MALLNEVKKKKEAAKIKGQVNRQSLMETNRRSVKELEGGRYRKGQLWLWPEAQRWCFPPASFLSLTLTQSVALFSTCCHTCKCKISVLFGLKGMYDKSQVCIFKD